jgi:hypothetical protein
MAAETSSPPAAMSSAVELDAAALACVTSMPILLRSPDAAASVSGTAITNGDIGVLLS